MVNFLKKRLQVFVSSTFLDLKKERQAAVSAILSAGHIPAGMELFTAGDQSQMEVIKQWIDESDVYLLILGSRYGSIEPETGKSYTHLEYDYAVSKNKPLFACVIQNSAIEPRVKELGMDVLERKNPQKLEDFRTVVLSKMSGFWSDTRDIELEIIKALQTFSRREDLTGWVKGNEAVDTVALTDELARLSKETADLRAENNQLKSQSTDNSDSNALGISYEKMKSILENTLITEKDQLATFSEESDMFTRIFKDTNIKTLLDFLEYIKDDLIVEDLVVNDSELNLDSQTNKKNNPKQGINCLFMLCEKRIMSFSSRFSVRDDYSFKLTEEGYKFLNWLHVHNNNKQEAAIN